MSPWSSLPSIERRLAHLERQHAAQQIERSLPRRMEAAAAACAEGSARLWQYQLNCSYEVHVRRIELIAMAPAILARERLGHHGDPRWRRLLAHSPDQNPPADLKEDFRALASMAVLSLRELNKMPLFTPPLNFRIGPELRQSCAIDILAVGGNLGLGLRNHIWNHQDNGWTLTEQTRSFAHELHTDITTVAMIFNSQGFDTGAVPLEGHTDPAGRFVVSYAAVADYIAGWVRSAEG